jgi:endonuclease/exonuclease/phosphatase family metal-dependent hydrolase
VQIYCSSTAPAWTLRQGRVARVINESGASVVGVQEAAGLAPGIKGYQDYQEKYGEDNAARGYETRPYVPVDQWEQVESLIAPAGYVAPVIDDKNNVCLRDRKNNKDYFVHCVTSPRIFYKDSIVTQMVNAKGQPAAGLSRLEFVAPSVGSDNGHRALAWAYFDSPSTGPFLALSMHLSNEKVGFVERDRQVIARALKTWTNKLNNQMGINTQTTVLMADLNSFQDRQPKGAQFVLKQNGWKDAWNAPKRTNVNYSTINVTPDTRDAEGFPAKPHTRWDNGPGTRIDYIFAKGPVTFTEYEVMLWTNPDGTFKKDYQASDHQAVRAVLKF